MKQPVKPLIIPFFIPHAGCPHTCLFCNQHLITQVEDAIPTAEQVRVTVQQWRERSPGRLSEVAFYGGSFTLLPRILQAELLGAAATMMELGEVSGIRISTRPDALDATTLSFLKSYGVTTIEIGVQSLDDRVLQAVVRGHNAAESLAAIKRVEQAGFAVGAQLLPGLPNDSVPAAMASIAGVIAAGAQFVRLYPAVVLAGTALAEAFYQGVYCPPDLEQGVGIAARMFQYAAAAGVPTIRIGLQADEGLSMQGAILAGCWHPALGHLVKSRLFGDLVLYLAAQMAIDGPCRLSCHPAKLSEVLGQSRKNLEIWQATGIMLKGVQVDQSLAEHEVCLLHDHQGITASYLTTNPYKGAMHDA